LDGRIRVGDDGRRDKDGGARRELDDYAKIP